MIKKFINNIRYRNIRDLYNKNLYKIDGLDIFSILSNSSPNHLISVCDEIYLTGLNSDFFINILLFGYSKDKILFNSNRVIHTIDEYENNSKIIFRFMELLRIALHIEDEQLLIDILNHYIVPLLHESLSLNAAERPKSFLYFILQEMVHNQLMDKLDKNYHNYLTLIIKKSFSDTETYKDDTNELFSLALIECHRHCPSFFSKPPISNELFKERLALKSLLDISGSEILEIIASNKEIPLNNEIQFD